MTICQECTEPPDGCWKAVEYGCQLKRHAAEKRAIENALCPIGKLGTDLRKVRTIVYTTDWRHDFHRRMAGLLGRLGFTNWGFFYGTKHEGPGDFRATVASDYATILRSHEPPLLLLEDDVDTREWNPVIAIPEGAQVAMLGGGKRGISAAARHAAKQHKARRAHAYAWVPIDQNWMRVFGMLWTHAYLWLDKAAMDEAAGLLQLHRRSADQTLAREQHRWNVVCRLLPIFFQFAGFQRGLTYDYAPQPAPPPEQPERRVKRLRAERLSALGVIRV